MFKKDKDREKGAKLIQDEAKKISAMFLRLSHATNPKVGCPSPGLDCKAFEM